jgi:hypothetical protein
MKSRNRLNIKSLWKDVFDCVQGINVGDGVKIGVMVAFLSSMNKSQVRDHFPFWDLHIRLCCILFENTCFLMHILKGQMPTRLSIRL